MISISNCADINFKEMADLLTWTQSQRLGHLIVEVRNVVAQGDTGMGLVAHIFTQGSNDSK